MPPGDADNDARIIVIAFEDRVKDLFKVFAEAVATGEPERDAVVRFRRSLLTARRVRDLALQSAQEASPT